MGYNILASILVFPNIYGNSPAGVSQHCLDFFLDYGGRPSNFVIAVVIAVMYSAVHQVLHDPVCIK